MIFARALAAENKKMGDNARYSLAVMVSSFL
ncbi:hypothetical protein HCH_07008 [Hahella chejuensis KCTC 2396]|uniref:Uncharacterized protein n=1 Tax=Hahella chejuensis (strain KCTC 2396) TaxID=349521 RepID=Q2S6V1_HAHCH|nr:hypothetical protein HCH_07008 [Hahella chejuensis KCTC 2396]